MNPDMNTPPKKSPVDELFARRLQAHRVSPDPATWQRLQTRLRAGTTPPRTLGVWQQPAVRYAAAACVLLLLLAGGRYLLHPETEQIANSQPTTNLKPAGERLAGGRSDGRRAKATGGEKNTNNRRAATLFPANESTGRIIGHPDGMTRPSGNPAGMTDRVSARSVEKKRRVNLSNQSPDLGRPDVLARQNPASRPTPPNPGETLAQTKNKPLLVSELPKTGPGSAGRVLIVTMAEPDALVEARKTANWSDSAAKTLTLDLTPLANGGKRPGLAPPGNPADRADMAAADERGLVNNAYRIIRNKLSKKPVKQ
jgi:hypothetical protein